MNEFDWGGIDTPGIYMDENNLRMTIHYRYAFCCPWPEPLWMKVKWIAQNWF